MKKKNGALQEFCRVAKFRILRKAFPPAHCSSPALFMLLFIFDFFLSPFGFLPVLSLVIAFGFGFFFCNFAWLGAVYKLRVHCKMESLFFAH